VALGEALFELWQDRGKAAALGERGFQGVRAHYSVAHSADRFLEVCAPLTAGASRARAAM